MMLSSGVVIFLYSKQSSTNKRIVEFVISYVVDEQDKEQGAQISYQGIVMMLLYL